MSRLHILQQSGFNQYSVVVHSPTPAGNNSAGVSWGTALANSGLQKQSVMTVGNGPGQIATAEANQVTSGSIIETMFTWQDDPTWDTPTRQADLNTRAIQAVNDATTNYGNLLKWFGLTVA